MEWLALYHEPSRVLGTALAQQYTTDVAEALGNNVAEHIQQFIPARINNNDSSLSAEKAA